ncbi:MAG: gluconokinase [Chloroflexi bacterium]|nr:gluconokinase [Chloroflexota bacterium]
MMKSLSFAIGIDLGIGSCKTVLLDESGHMLSQASADYPASDTASRWQEQRPESLLEGLVASVRSAVQTSGLNPANCLGITVGGALHSLTALDKRDQPLLGVLTWADNRALQQAGQIRQSGRAHDLYLRTGCPSHAIFPIYKILWLRENHPDVFARAAWFLSAKEYVLFRMTGKRIVDYNVAAGSGLLNTLNFGWDKEMLSLAGISPEQLSTIANPREFVGWLKPALATKMGLDPHTPVILGSSDAVNDSLGAGAVSRRQATCMVGASGAIRCLQNQPVLDAQERICCYAVDQQHWLVGGAINNGGLAASWLKDAFSNGKAGGPSAPSFDDLMAWASEIPAGSEGVLCLPFFTAERSPDWNSDVRGAFYGLQLNHNQRHLSRALLEGVAFRLRSVMDSLDVTIPGLTELRASGGFVQSPIWLQITADVLNRPLHIPAVKETSAMAAAFWVFLNAGLFSSFEDLAKLAPIAKQVEPLAEHQPIYQQQYQRYQELYRALLPVFKPPSTPSS